MVDLDGVLSDAAGRQHLVTGGRHDWDDFFERCGQDPVLDDTRRLVDLLDPALRVVLLTARPESVHPQTAAWLERHGLRWDLLVMRPDGDRSSALELKRQRLHELRSLGLEVVIGFEDDRRNVEMFRSEGVPCVYVHSGYYE